MAQGERITKKELKEDRFVTLTLEFYEFLKSNLQTIMIAIGVVIIIMAAFSIYYNYRRQKETAASIAMEEAIKLFSEAENDWTDQKKAASSIDKYEEAKARFDSVVMNYGSSVYADKALYYSAKSSYQIGEYDKALVGFRQLVDKYPKSIFALYGQQAIGNCYEQKGGEDNLRKAIKEYAPEKFEKFASIPEHGHVVAESLFRQAELYEKLGQQADALQSYNRIIDTFNTNLKKAVDDKISRMLKEAKALAEKITQNSEESIRSNFAAANSYEAAGKHYEALEAYSNAIHQYFSAHEGSTSIPQKLNEKISEYDKNATEFFKNIRDARRYESQGRQSSALYAYDRAVGLNFAPTRDLYEKALLQRDRIQLSEELSKD